MTKAGKRDGERRSQLRVTLSRSIQPPGAGRTASRSGLAQCGTADWGLAQDAVRPGRDVRELPCREKGEERSPPSRHAVSWRAGGNCVAMVSARPAAAVGEPERVWPEA